MDFIDGFIAGFGTGGFFELGGFFGGWCFVCFFSFKIVRLVFVFVRFSIV